RPDFLPLAVTFKRVANIVEKQGRDLAGSVDRNLLNEEAERALHRRTNEAAEAVRRDVERDDHAPALPPLAGLKPVAAAFFDKVMVMTAEKALRANRVSLLREVRALFNEVGDFSKVQGEAAE